MIGIQIIKNSIKRKLYDYKTLIMISLFPLVLTTIFVNVFSKAEEGNLGEISLIIQSENEEIGNAYSTMLEVINESESISVQYEMLENGVDGKEVLKKEKTDFLVYLTEAPFKIEIVKGKGSGLENMQIEGISQNFARQLVLGELTGGQVPNTEEVWNYKKIETEETIPIAVGMAVTMIAFGALLGGQYGINQIFYIREAIGKRVITAPIRETSLYVYEIIASFIMLFAVTLGLVGIYSVSYDLGFGKNVLGVVGIVAALALMAITMGVIIGMIAPSLSAGENILAILVVALNFTSGGFTPGVDLGIVGKISPIRGIVDVLTSIVTTGEAEGIARVMISILGICIVLLVIGCGVLKAKKGGIVYGKHIKAS